jgi:hypothetical protein
VPPARDDPQLVQKRAVSGSLVPQFTQKAMELTSIQ